AVAETYALMRARDQARDIRNHELASIDARHAELRIERGERVVRNLWLGGTHRGQKCGFPGIGQADDASIRDQFEPQPNGAVLAHAAAAVLGPEMLLVAVIDQGVEAVDRPRHHVPALAAVPAVGTPELDEFLPPERDTAVPAVAGADVNLGLVEEFHGFFLFP